MSPLRSLILTLWTVLALAAPVMAQQIGPTQPAPVKTVQPTGPDYAAWQQVATRAERAAEDQIASNFALERLRLELVSWRDQFLAAQSVNGPRINTVQGQIAAMGPKPDGADEGILVTARRIALDQQLRRLRAPVLMAEEAYAQANGLIGEIDALMRVRDAERLTARGPSPLDPANWSRGLDALWTGFTAMVMESRAALTTKMRVGTASRSLLLVLASLVVAVILISRGRRWVEQGHKAMMARPRLGQGVWAFVISLGEIALPYGGLLLLSESIVQSDLVGFRGAQLAQVLPQAGLLVILARWLCTHFFPAGEARGPLDLDETYDRRGRSTLMGLGWTLALGAVMVTMVNAADTSAATAAVIVLPIEILVSVFLFRLGQLFVLHAEASKGTMNYRASVIGLLGRFCMVIAVAGPLLAAAGYATASQALLFPAIRSLAVLAVMVLLQRFLTDLYGYVSGNPDGQRDTLIPVLIGFVLLVAALPVLALIWGARTTDLIEIWARFREGFSIGDTRLSPTALLTFAVIFTVGYTLTRLVQGTLRTTVLPKTRMDIGGQNAITAGLGYVGIFLAALAAITGAGIDLSSLAIVAGALSVGIGFGLQNIVSNFVSGIILLIERPISEGDWIEVGGHMGYVRDISVRSTRIETFDRTDVIIPNADLVSGQVVNWTRGNSVGRVIVPVGVAYGTDTAMVAGILKEIADAHPMVLMSPPPNIIFMGFGADSLNFEIRAILRDVNFSLNTKSEMNHEIAKRFAAEGIEIPFAQRDIWLRNPEVLRPAAPQPPKGPEEPTT